MDSKEAFKSGKMKSDQSYRDIYFCLTLGIVSFIIIILTGIYIETL